MKVQQLTNPGSRLFRLLLPLLLVVCAPAALFAAQGAKAVPAKAVKTRQATMITPETKAEKQSNDKVRKACQGKGEWKTTQVLRNHKPVNLTLRKAILAALQKNLSIRRKQISEQIAKDALIESRAVFDPVFTFSWSFSQSEKYRRTEMTRKWHKATQKYDINSDGVAENVLFMPEEAQEQAGIQALEFRDPRSTHYSWDEVVASEIDGNGPDRTRMYNLGVSQALPWGLQMNLGLVLADHDTFFNSDHGKYDRPWTAALSASGWIPLPFTKSFGPHSLNHTTIRLQEIAAQQSLWQVRLIINATLLQVDSAYWDLVAAMQQFEATIQSRKTLEALLATTEKLIQAKRATAYGKYQILASLAQVRALEELRLQVYITASNQLARILDQRTPVVYLPTGYSKLLKAGIRAVDDHVMDTAMRDRPLMHLAELGVRSADISRLYAMVEAKPDLSWTTSFTMGQTGTVFGYLRVKDALRKLDEMDKRIMSQTITYNLPWRNWAYRAQYQVAKSQYRQAKMSKTQSRNQVENDVMNALAMVESAKARTKVAMENLKLAREAFAAARKLREAGRIQEFEIVSKNDAVLQAEIRRILAEIDQRKAESLLLYAMGHIAEKFGEMTAVTRFDQHRLGLLAKSGALKFFGRTDSNSKKRPGSNPGVSR